MHYCPLHQLSVWKDFCGEARFPAADLVFSRTVSLPLFMDMRDDEQDRVIDVVRQVLLSA